MDASLNTMGIIGVAFWALCYGGATRERRVMHAEGAIGLLGLDDITRGCRAAGVGEPPHVRLLGVRG